METPDELRKVVMLFTMGSPPYLQTKLLRRICRVCGGIGLAAPEAPEDVIGCKCDEDLENAEC
jgi:hypothetical protein